MVPSRMTNSVCLKNQSAARPSCRCCARSPGLATKSLPSAARRMSSSGRRCKAARTQIPQRARRQGGQHAAAAAAPRGPGVEQNDVAQFERGDQAFAARGDAADAHGHPQRRARLPSPGGAQLADSRHNPAMQRSPRQRQHQPAGQKQPHQDFRKGWRKPSTAVTGSGSVTFMETFEVVRNYDPGTVPWIRRETAARSQTTGRKRAWTTTLADGTAVCRSTRDSRSACGADTPANSRCWRRRADSRRDGGRFRLLRKPGHDTGTALRILRQLVLERLSQLDCDQQAPLGLVTLRSPSWPSSRWTSLASTPAATRRAHSARRARRMARGPNCGWSAWASWVRANSTCRATST